MVCIWNETNIQGRRLNKGKSYSIEVLLHLYITPIKLLCNNAIHLLYLIVLSKFSTKLLEKLGIVQFLECGLRVKISSYY